MPSLDLYKQRLQQRGNTIGQVHKYNSDQIMEQTWDRDIQSKICYIYDYHHDDQWWKNTGITYQNTTKTRIDAKFSIVRYQSTDSDVVDYHLQFRPSQKVQFNQLDDLYYYETDYREKYGAPFPIGMYIDIPNEKGVYEKWIICAEEPTLQFKTYIILPCNYLLHWIEVAGEQKIKRKMWCATRSQNSYNSGLWQSDMVQTIEQQFKTILPMNSITENLFYKTGNNQNTRFVISAPTSQPLVWQLSKVEHMVVGNFGLMRLTFAQDQWNTVTDHICKDELFPDETKDIFAMYANYYAGSTTIEATDTTMSKIESIMKCKLTCATNTIKVNGGYKTITANFYDGLGNDITEEYMSSITADSWKFMIDKIDVSSELVSTIMQSQKNKIKVKFTGNRDYLTKNLIVECHAGTFVGKLDLEIVAT